MEEAPEDQMGTGPVGGQTSLLVFTLNEGDQRVETRTREGLGSRTLG